MNEASGYGEIKIGDKTFPVKFGVNACRLFCEYHDIELHQMKDFNSPIHAAEMAYFAHVTAVRINKGLTDVSMDEFIDRVGDNDGVLDDIERIFRSSKIWGKPLAEDDSKKK